MESWRGGVRRVGREAREWFAAAWRTDVSPGGTGVIHAESGSGPLVRDDGSAEKERIARGTGVQEQMARGTDVPEQMARGTDVPEQMARGTDVQEQMARGTGAQEQIARGAAVRELSRASEPGRQPADAPDHQVTVPEQNRVPSWLQTAAAWSWRLLLIAIAIYLIARLLGILYIVVVPCVAALLLTALLQPLTSRLRRAGLPAMLATWVTLLIAAVVLGGLGAGCAAPLIALGRATVEVDDGALRAGSTALPLTAISEVVALDERQSARLRGPRADPAAHFYSRPYLKESVYVAVDPAAHPDGGVPYWLIGTRHPADLAAAIERCRIRAGHEPVA